jgi:hypothetical protein
VVAYVSNNTITNKGGEAWKKETGLLSVWILGMLQSSPATTVVAPIKSGAESELGAKVTSDYFGEIPPDRLVVGDEAVFLRADGQYRSKIGIGPRRSNAVLGSYDADNHLLTIVRFNQPEGVTDYVNSLWKLQDNPYGGDAASSYNDGPGAWGKADGTTAKSDPAGGGLDRREPDASARSPHGPGPLDRVAKGPGVSLLRLRKRSPSLIEFEPDPIYLCR